MPGEAPSEETAHNDGSTPAEEEQHQSPANDGDAVSQTQGEAAPASTQDSAVVKDSTPETPDIFLLARQQNFAVVLKLLDAYPQHWSAHDDDGHSLLHWAALVGNKDFVLCGLSKKCPVDLQAKNLQTPLMWAILRGHLPVARALLDAKANPQLHDSLGATPLMIAIQHQSHKAVLLLMHRGKQALLSDRDANGCTPAHWAAYKGDITALKLLDYFDADLQALDNSKMLPLHRAVCASQAIVVEFLVQRRSDLTQKNAEGKSCMDIVEEQQGGHMQMMLKRLLANASKGKDDLESGSAESNGGEKKNEGMFKSLVKDKAAQKIFPVFWLICVSLAVFEYLMDLRATSYQVAPTASLLFELGVPLSLALFASVALGDPGKLPPRIKGNSGVEELMRALDGGAPESNVPDISRLCMTTWVLKDLRTKYCAQTGACVQEFDHYCVWLNCAIGKGNHRQFMGLAIAEWLTQVCHLYLCCAMARTLVVYQTFWGWFFGVLTGYPLLALLALVHAFTAVWVLVLIFFQSRLILKNLTTNEMMNMHRYEHFWQIAPAMPGHMQKAFRNPFHKGSVFMNCLDFWWMRRRSQMVAQSDCGHAGCKAQHGHHHH